MTLYGSIMSSDDVTDMSNRNNFTRFLSDVKSDIVSYLEEYKCTIFVDSADTLEAQNDLQISIERNDVVVIEKEGCGFCERAKSLLREEYDLNPKLIVGTPPAYRAALKKILGLPVLTFPVVYIKGMYLGGEEEIQRLHRSGELSKLISDETDRVPWSMNNRILHKEKPKYLYAFLMNFSIRFFFSIENFVPNNFEIFEIFSENTVSFQGLSISGIAFISMYMLMFSVP